MRILFALPGLHRFDRGAEVAFIAIANELTKAGDEITLIGSGTARSSSPYRFLHAASMARERFESFPSLPGLRDECAYEELTFIPDFIRRYRPSDYDVTVTCSYPYINWVLRRPTMGGQRPAHVFVTQNGDWPARANNAEYRFFGCEGLICTNPDFYERNKAQRNCRLIPNGVDCDRFTAGPSQRHLFGLPKGRRVVLMVSALISTKRVEVGIDAVSRIPGVHLAVAGDGPLRREIEAKAARQLPGRFTQLSVAPQLMPQLYRSADVFLHLSKEEAFGNVYLEAMACGLPIVGHDTPRLRWIVGKEEYLIDTTHPTAVAEAIIHAGNCSPSAAADRVARAAAFSWSSIGKMYHEFLQEVLSVRRGTPRNVHSGVGAS